MHRRTWDADLNATSVIPGLQGQPVAAVWQADQRRQAPDDQGRDQWLAKAARTFDVQPDARQDTRLARAHARRHALVGELPPALTHSDEGLG
jgi:hypothetical protein